MSEIWLNDDNDDDDAFELPELIDFVPEKTDSDQTKLSALEERLQTNSSLNSRCSPAIDERIFSKIIIEIATIINDVSLFLHLNHFTYFNFKVIPNSVIKGIGPSFHECGSFLNFSINEKTKEIKSIWFFFGLAIFICDEKGNEIASINELLLQLWIKKIQLKLHESGIAQHSDIVIKTVCLGF